jgi:GT2 family glycosyltransferase
MVYIIVLNWNGAEDTVHCLNSLLKINNKKCAILVCDNGSSDGSTERIISWHAALSNDVKDGVEFKFYNFSEMESVKFEPSKYNIHLISIGRNLGYAGGNNVGLNFARKQVDCEAVWVINNDTEVHSEALKKSSIRKK